jgi:hypothetical protein
MGLEYSNMFINDGYGVHTMKLIALEIWWALSEHIHMKFNLLVDVLIELGISM